MGGEILSDLNWIMTSWNRPELFSLPFWAWPSCQNMVSQDSRAICWTLIKNEDKRIGKGRRPFTIIEDMHCLLGTPNWDLFKDHNILMYIFLIHCPLFSLSARRLSERIRRGQCYWVLMPKTIYT